MPLLSELSASILADRKIDADEIVKLKEIIYADGKIDTDEADMLFELNDECSNAENDPQWGDFFSDAICSYMLQDEDSAGVVDSQEADWLLGKINKDGKLDKVEIMLLSKLKERAKSIPDNLNSFITQNT